LEVFEQFKDKRRGHGLRARLKTSITNAVTPHYEKEMYVQCMYFPPLSLGCVTLPTLVMPNGN
jgi:hypothetical protein